MELVKELAKSLSMTPAQAAARYPTLEGGQMFSEGGLATIRCRDNAAMRRAKASGESFEPEGPPYIKHGHKVFYLVKEFDEWVAGGMVGGPQKEMV